MKDYVFEAMRMLVPMSLVLVFGLVACEPKNNEGDFDVISGEIGNTTSEIAVTGLVDSFGCTYADVSGYANLTLLPAGSGNPVVGVEIIEVGAEELSIVRSTTMTLIGNIFTVSFPDLLPATQYEYRSFVTYGGTTYYGRRRMFTTKDVIGVTSEVEASEIAIKSAVLRFSAQTEEISSRESMCVGLAYSTSRLAIHPDSVFCCFRDSVRNVVDSVYTVMLKDLPESTTFYYASFTEIGGEYVFSSIGEFTTKKLQVSGAVDLGLSVLWSACNVGADSPEEYGGYYAWGEIEEKELYDWNTYKWSNGEGTSLIKYCSHSAYGMVDNKTNLEPEDDVACVKLGDEWRMPTSNEVYELRYNCTWEWTEINGIKGELVTASNGNSIFLPAAGICYGKDLYDRRGSRVYYWSATTNGMNCAYYLHRGDKMMLSYEDYRYRGFPIRPVKQ